MTGHRWIMRWWPGIYAIAWALWAVLAPEPWFGQTEVLAHVIAGLGAVGLAAMALRPGIKWVRFTGTLAAIAYPLHRALSIATEPDSLPDGARRAIAVSFALVVVISLLVMYPSLWWISHRGELEGGDRDRL